MKLKTLVLDHFCSFEHYEVTFPPDDDATILITGKNNAGKSSIILALKLLNYAMKHSKGSRQSVVSTLTKKDLIDIDIRRLVHNFDEGQASITAIFDGERDITLNLDPIEGSVTYSLPPHLQRSMLDVFGFIPPLGQIADIEQRIGLVQVNKSINSQLAPSHLRNQIHYLLSAEQFTLLKSLIIESWDNIELPPPLSTILIVIH
jgi:energy-coupling factor transporter ATP-binding protein EcfA2